MTFRPAQCPTCGGSLQVPDDHATVRCLYCGGTVIVRDAIEAASAASIPNLLKLARTAANSRNHQEAYDYFSRVLELDGDNSTAWAGKGEAAGWLSHQTSRLPELINCFRNAIEVATDQTRDEIEEQIARVTCGITKQSYDNMRAGLSSAFAEEGTWTLYLESMGTLIETLERSHELVPENTSILRLAALMCEEHSGKVAYINRRSGQTNWRTLSPDWNTFFSRRRDYFSEKLYMLDPAARPIQPKPLGMLQGILTSIQGKFSSSEQAIIVIGAVLIGLALIAAAIHISLYGPPQPNRPSPPSPVAKFPGTSEEKTYLEASGRYLNLHFEKCKSASVTMAGASDGSSTLSDIRTALLESRSEINDSWGRDFLPVSNGTVPARFADFDKKLRRVHTLQESAFVELLRYWTDQRLSHITTGSSMFKKALLECDSAVKDLSKILDSFGSVPPKNNR